MRSANGRTFLTANDLARICDVDLKTIHNWADGGKLECFRTPGRHLRFGKDKARAFLERHGYPVPPELVASTHDEQRESRALAVQLGNVLAILDAHVRENSDVLEGEDAAVVSAARRALKAHEERQLGALLDEWEAQEAAEERRALTA